MTPPLRVAAAGPSLSPNVIDDSHSNLATPAKAPIFRASPALDLRSDLRNPIRSTRNISTLGDVRDAIVFDFIQGRLRSGTRGAQVVQQLGSFPGFIHPKAPLTGWKPDEKPDFNIIGDVQTILENLAPLMVWNQTTLEANQQMAARGMVYYNPTIETLTGPVKFKIGIIDTGLWRQGSFYFDLRASMLPKEGTYIFLGEEGEGSISPQELQDRVLKTQAEILGKTLDSFMREDSFSADALTARRFRHQFNYYEWYRVFDVSRGQKQRMRFEREGINVPEMIVPGLRLYLEQNPNVLSVRCGGKALTPDEITSENFYDLQFVSLRSPEQRKEAYQKHQNERWKINHQNMFQSLRNISTTRATRPGPNKNGALAYVVRKVVRWVGIEDKSFPREYSPEASHFNTLDQRLGRTDNPVSQMIILAGYPPKDESDPEIFREMVEYAEAEISKGSEPNILFRGNNPSKFTLPVRGVPVIAYRLMDALRSPAVKDIVVVGTPDVGVILDAFKNHFATEIESRGKNFIYVDTGLEGGGFAKNIQQGLDELPQHEKMGILSFGDTPRVDPHNIAFHPWRHNLDYIFGANGRDMVLNFMGMNAHYQGEMDGVQYPLKEGNTQGVRVMPRGLWEEMFANRKSVKSGPLTKVYILIKYLLQSPWHPNILNIPHLIMDTVTRSFGNFLSRFLGRKSPMVAANIKLVEETTASRLKWSADFRPNHVDMGGLVDVDGVRDYVVAEALGRVYNHHYWEDLNRFTQEALLPRKAELPALEGTSHRINQIYMHIRDELLEREAKRPTDEKLGITDETLRRKGFDPDVLPFQGDGQMNPSWLERVMPAPEIEEYRKAFVAYDNRVNHAQGLEEEFRHRLQATLPYDVDKARPKIQKFVLSQLNIDPEHYRGLILEWDFSRLREALVKKAGVRFGEFAPEVEEFKNYFQMSTEDNIDSPLRRVLLGMKAVDVLRRYQTHLSPEEFRKLHPLLVEQIHEARGVLPGDRWLRSWPAGPLKDGRFYLRGFFDQAQITADRVYLQRIGESPPPYRGRGFGLFQPHSNSRSSVYQQSSGKIQRVDSAVYRSEDLDLMARRLDLMPSRIPYLIAEAAGAGSNRTLIQISTERMSFDRLLAWTQSTAGQELLKGPGLAHRDTLRNRFLESGPGLALGLVSMLGGAKLADGLGFDPQYHNLERFMVVVGASHLVNQGASAVRDVIFNRSLGQGFDFVSTRTVNAGSELGLQYSFEARESLTRALGASLARNFGLEGSLGRMAWNGLKSSATLPFRAAWGMGAGLMSAALIDKTLGRGLAEGSPERNALHFGSFFLPDVYRIAVGNRGPAIFSTRGMRFAGQVFAAGFIADMMFLGIDRLQNNSKTSSINQEVYQLANRLHDITESAWRRPLDGAFEMVAPSLAAWWDSVDFDWNRFKFTPNHFQTAAREELQKLSSFQERSLPKDAQGRPLPVREVLEQISNPQIYRTRIQGRPYQEQVAYIQRQFRAHRLSREDVDKIFQYVAPSRSI